jgi:CO/xanthine dehydrogenase Mo-binding subunit
MIPSFLDVPTSLTTWTLESLASDAEPHGLGENAVGPIPAAVAAAVYRAVGVRVNRWPITPETVLRALLHRDDSAEQRSGAAMADGDVR